MGDLAIAVAIVAAVQKIYSFYQQAVSLLQGSGPSEDDEILQTVQAITQEIGQIADVLTALKNLILEGLQETLQSEVDTTVTQVQIQASAAQSAAENYAEWVQAGKPGVGTPAVVNQNAWQQSLSAATALRDTTEFFIKPVVTANGVSNQFDYRLAIAQYVYALTVRLTVIMGMELAWTSDQAVLLELEQHAARLTDLAGQMDAGITFTATTWLPPTSDDPESRFMETGFATDTVSTYSTGNYPITYLDLPAAELQALEQWIKTYVTTEVSDVIGSTTIKQFAAQVQWYSAGAPATGVWTPWSAIATANSAGDDLPDADSTSEGWPLALVSPAPNALTACWGIPGAVWTVTSVDGGGTWGPMTQIPGSATAGSFESISSVPQLVATEAGNGSTCVFWTATDGSVKGSYFDPRASAPAWAEAIDVVPGPGGPVPTAPDLLGAASAAPESVAVFYQPVASSVLAVSFTLNAQDVDGKSAVNASPVSAPVDTGAGSPASGWFQALSSGPGSISLLYFTGTAIEGTYFDQRASDPAWAPLFVVTNDIPGVPATTPFLSGLTAVSPAPYAVDVYLAAGDLTNATAYSTSFSLQVTEDNPVFSLRVTEDNPADVLAHRVVTPTSPSPLTAVGPTTSQVLSMGPGLAAVATAPAAAGSPAAGAATLFWMCESQTVAFAVSTGAAAWGPLSQVGAPLGTPLGPIAAASPAPGSITLLAMVPQSHPQGGNADFALQAASWRPGKLPFMPTPVRPRV